MGSPEMAEATTLCAECGRAIAEVQRWSFYFERPLCVPCYRAELRRPKRESEIWILEQLFTKASP